MMNNSRTKPQPKGGLTWEREKAVVVAAATPVVVLDIFLVCFRICHCRRPLAARYLRKSCWEFRSVGWTGRSNGHG